MRVDLHVDVYTTSSTCSQHIGCVDLNWMPRSFFLSHVCHQPSASTETCLGDCSPPLDHNSLRGSSQYESALDDAIALAKTHPTISKDFNNVVQTANTLGGGFAAATTRRDVSMVLVHRDNTAAQPCPPCVATVDDLNNVYDLGIQINGRAYPLWKAKWLLC